MTLTRATLGEQVADGVLAEIKERGLRPGDELPAEGEIAERYGVNRLAVREAIRTLAARGILITSQGRRARVATPSPAVFQQLLDFRLSQNSWDFAEIVETRQVIEGELARRLARRCATEEVDLSRARAALESMRDVVDDREQFVVHDLGFHLAIAEIADAAVLSFILSAMHGVLHDAFRASYDGHSRRGADHNETIDAHQRILEAIAAGDADGAAAEMNQHLDHTRLDLLGEADGAQGAAPKAAGA